MTAGERLSFNAALAERNKLREWARIRRALEHKIDITGEREALDLMRKIEALL